MAKGKKKASKGEDNPRSPKADLLVRIRERYRIMTEADQENRRLALEDLRFANEPGAQWDANMKKKRGNRPCYEFNKVRINGKRVINEIRANRPQGKVRAVEGGDKKTAELYEGLCRNIANVSDFDTVTDQAAEYQVDAGMAAWRVVTEYSDDTAFDQDIVIKPFKNPFCVYADPACQDILKRDAEDWIVTERISRKAFEARWPKAEVIEFEESVEFDDEDEWEDGESVRICEYWYKEPYDKEIWLIQGPNGPITVDSTTDEAAALKAQGVTPIRTRTARCHRIKMCIASGDAILEEADWAGTQFPFVMIYGEYKVIDGKVQWWGLHRFAKDAQRSYNSSRTAIDETIALAPQAKWWATAEQAKGLTQQWAVAHNENLPWLPYNPDPKANNGGPPVPMAGAQVPVALIQQSAIAAQDLRDVTGLHEASFGEESSEKSGVALARKQNQAQMVTYNFPDNMAKGVRRTWEILIDLIPHIYDAERELRVIGADGAEDYARVNQIVQDPATGQAIRINDLSTGKYDVTVTVGPNFSTMRQEAAEVYGELGSRSPELMQVAGDLVFKAMDLPYADEIAKRWQAILPPPIQQMISEGKEIPPEAQAVMAQAQQAMQMVQQQTQLVQQAAQEVQQDKAASDQAKANVEKAIANLKAEEARFEAKIAKAMADLQVREAQLEVKGAMTATKESDLTHREVRMKDYESGLGDIDGIKSTIAQLDAMLAQYIEAANQTMQQISAQATKPKRKLKAATTKREGGELLAEMAFDDGSVERFKAARQGGNLVAVPLDAAPTGAPQGIQ